MTYRIKANEGVPQLSTNEKLEQIRSGKKLQRRKSGVDVNKIIIAGKDGSKITKRQTAEKFEETTVKRKKRNYIMYESKLGTEKNTEITREQMKIQKPRPVRTPAPRVEERIIQTKKKKEYLDNYQYHETKVLKRKNPSIVMHKRLGDIIGGTYEETTYQKQVYVDGKNRPQLQQEKKTISTTGTANPRLRGNRSDMKNSKPPAATATNFHKRTQSTIVEDKNQRSSSKPKSGVVTNQIMSRRGGPSGTYQTKTEVKRQTTMSRTRDDAKTPGQQRSNSTKSITTTTTTVTTKVRRGNNDNSAKPETKVETKIERSSSAKNVSDDKGDSIRKKYQRKH
jgi:hypothetical protein